VRAEADLHRMLAKTGELFDVRELDGGGEISGQLNWTHRKQQIELDGRIWLDDFVWASLGRPPWRETQLALHLALKLQQDPDGSIAGIPSASFDLTAPAERVIVKLRRPVAAPWDGAEWAFDLEASGRVERWKPRLQPLIDVTEIDMGGLIDLRGKLTVSPQRIDVESLSANVEQFLFARQAFRIDEPQVALQLGGEWSRTTGSWRSEQIQIQTSTVSASSADLQVLIHDPAYETDANGNGASASVVGSSDRSVGPPEEAPARTVRIRGDMNIFSDLARLQNWFATTQTRTNRVEGEVRGVARFATSESGSQLNLQLDITPFRLLGWRESPSARGRQGTGGWQPLWVEPKVTLRGEGALDTNAQMLSLSDFRLTGEGLFLRGGGTLDDLTGRIVSDIRGELQYDLQPLSEKLRNLTVQQLTMSGRQRQEFSLQGPLRRPTVLVESPVVAAASQAVLTETTAIIPRDLEGRVVFGWDSIEVMAFPIGAGQIGGHLEDARLQFSLINIPVSGGRMTASPYLDFTQPPARLKLPAGPLLNDVQITPRMCRSWLQYVAPLVANATSAEGQFGLQLDQLEMPLGAAESASISGALAIQEARIGPGPLAQQVITVAESIPAILGRRIPGLSSQSERWIYLPAQVVAFDVNEGRVSHQQLEMRVGDIRLTTTGWVALDQTMSLTVNVWIRDEWIQRNPLLEGLRGQSIAIPVSGSLARPQVDQRILTDLSRQALGSAAGGLLRDLFDRQRPR
jgi:translocation and assembly module TamB